MEKQKVFADGFIFKRSDKAPDFVVGNISIKVEEAISFLKKNEKNGWINLQVKNSQGGKYYMELDTFEPKQQQQEQPKAQTEQVQQDLPF